MPPVESPEPHVFFLIDKCRIDIDRGYIGKLVVVVPAYHIAGFHVVHKRTFVSCAYQQLTASVDGQHLIDTQIVERMREIAVADFEAMQIEELDAVFGTQKYLFTVTDHTVYNIVPSYDDFGNQAQRAVELYQLCPIGEPQVAVTVGNGSIYDLPIDFDARYKRLVFFIYLVQPVIAVCIYSPGILDKSEKKTFHTGRCTLRVSVKLVLPPCHRTDTLPGRYPQLGGVVDIKACNEIGGYGVFVGFVIEEYIIAFAEALTKSVCRSYPYISQAVLGKSIDPKV